MKATKSIKNRYYLLKIPSFNVMNNYIKGIDKANIDFIIGQTHKNNL